MKLIRKILVVGGGTAGCISALMLKSRFPHFEIQLIESAKIGIVGVGESSTEQWSKFCQFVGIDKIEPIFECNATFKGAVYFKGWAENDFMHNLTSPQNTLYGDYYGVYAYLIAHDRSPFEMYDPRSYVNEIGVENFNHNNDCPVNQFHFDAFELNKFLHRKCIEKGIKIVVGDIIAVTKNEDTDELVSVRTESEEYFADFFIDCSGFRRLLMNGTYGIKWKSYEEYLPLNSAFAFQTEEMEEYNKYPISTARSAGWSWTIPTQTRTGNGYVYCDRYIDDDAAVEEIERAYGHEITIAKKFKFTPGRLEKSWHKNCFAIGLSSTFVEPLEGTSIGSIIQQMFCFMQFLPSGDEKVCNERVNDMFDNIVDFIQAHYLVKKEDTPFWKDIKYNLKLTDNLSGYLESWKDRLPCATDIQCPWGMYRASNYIPILYGLGWFDVNKIKQEYFYYHAPIIHQDVEFKLQQKERFMFPISHKKFIQEILRR